MNKDNILNLITEQEIYLKFLNLSQFPKGNISSPFSEDKNASFKLYKNGTFKCHSTGKQGDVFQFVADLNQIDCKSQFNKVLELIVKECNLDLNGNATTLANKRANTLKQSKNNQEKHFNYTAKNLEDIHLNYWNKYNWNVTPEVLKKYKQLK